MAGTIYHSVGVFRKRWRYWRSRLLKIKSLVAMPERIDFIFGVMTQSGLASVALTLSTLGGVAINQSKFMNVGLQK